MLYTRASVLYDAHSEDYLIITIVQDSVGMNKFQNPSIYIPPRIPTSAVPLQKRKVRGLYISILPLSSRWITIEDIQRKKGKEITLPKQ